MCNPFDPTECLVDIADEVGESIFETIAKAFAQAAGAMAQEMFTWWVDTDSSVDASLMQDMQDLLIPFAVFVGVLAVTVGGIKMVLSRKADPLLDIGTGLFLLAFWTGAGISAVVLALKLADSLGLHPRRNHRRRPPQTLGTFLIVGAVANPGLILVLAIIVLIASIILWVLSFLRIASTVVLAGLTPLAAAAGMTEGFKGGLRKLVMWMVALIAFKPACAFIYGCGFLAIGKGNGIGAAMIGVTILSLAVVALPAMLKLFSFILDQGAPKLSGFAAASGAAVGAAATGAALVSGGTTLAASFAAHTASSGGSSPDGAEPTGGASVGDASSSADSGGGDGGQRAGAA